MKEIKVKSPTSSIKQVRFDSVQSLQSGPQQLDKKAYVKMQQKRRRRLASLSKKVDGPTKVDSMKKVRSLLNGKLNLE